MTKQEYLKELAIQLQRLPAQEIEEILSDYREHFDMGLRAGKTEMEIAQSLGPPRTVAQGYLVSRLFNEVHNSPSVMTRSKILLKIMALILILAPFNFLVIAGPFLILFALTVVGWAIPIAISGVSIAVLGAAITRSDFLASGLEGLSLLFMLLGTLGVAAMAAMIMILLSKGLTHLVASYLRWNMDFINARRA
jgi:uncharacterized membrane protein